MTLRSSRQALVEIQPDVILAWTFGRVNLDNGAIPIGGHERVRQVVELHRAHLSVVENRRVDESTIQSTSLGSRILPH